jgi:hypothetical protein
LSTLTGTVFTIEKKLAAFGDTYQISDASGNLLATVKKDGLSFTFETSNGAKIGEIFGSQPNNTLPDYREIYDFHILDDKGAVLAKVKLKAFPHQRTDFLRNAAWNFDYSWSVEGPAGEELAKIKRPGDITDASVAIDSIESASGEVVAKFERKALSLRQNCRVEILDPRISPYLVLAALFAHPPSRPATKGGHQMYVI